MFEPDETARYFEHELKQPLSAIAINAEAALAWLRQDQVDMELARPALCRIIGNVFRARDIIRSLSEPNTAAIAAGCDLNETILSILALKALDIDQHGILVETELAKDLPRAGADQNRVRQVVSNLVSNAIEALRTVEDRPRNLRITTQRDAEGGLLTAFEDAGEGMNLANPNDIFHPGFTTVHGQMGLGICRFIIESSGGRLWLSPNIPSGSIVCFVVPAENH